MRYLFLLLLSAGLYADNEIYVTQAGSNASIDLEQLGSSNLIGATSAVSGTKLDLVIFLDLTQSMVTISQDFLSGMAIATFGIYWLTAQVY